MANERSGIPSSDDSEDLRDLFPGPGAPPPREKKAPPPPKAKDPAPVGADGWPSWMGDPSPSLAPAPPPPPPPRAKPAAPPPKPAVAPVAARAAAVPPRQAAPASSRATERKPAPPKLPVAPAPASVANGPRRWPRMAACAFGVLLALVAGEMVARSRPEAAVRFQEAVSGTHDHLPIPVQSALLPFAGGVTALIVGILAWQAGRPRRPLLLPLAVILCLASAAFGMYRGGRDVDVERSAALFKGRVGSLESELGALRRKLASSVSAETMAQALAGLEQKLKEQTAQAQEAKADRDKMAGSLQQSSLIHQATLKERDEALSALRKEIDELRKKLAEKN